MGWPVEGPAALEAIANGVVYLNPRFTPARDVHVNKPTSRRLTSQHPYAEKYIGPPHVYNYDMSDLEELEKTLNSILESPRPKPKVTEEFTPYGFLKVSLFYE